jgi:hypothetical protein
MKKNILKLSLLSFVLFLGFTSADASAYKVTVASLTTTVNTIGLSNSPVAATASNYAVAGFSITGSGTTVGSSVITTLNFYENGSTGTDDNALYTTAYLYSSTSATWLGTANAASTLIATEAADASYDPTFTGLNIAVSNTSAAQYFFIVLSNTLGNAAGGTFNLEYNGCTVTGTAVTPATGATGPNYTFATTATPVSATATSLATGANPAQPGAGLTANPITATGTKLPVYGLQLVPSATGSERTITALNFTAVTSPTENNNYFFGNIYLYSSTSTTYSAGTSTLVSTIAAGATATANFTGLNILVDPGKTLYYFVLVDYNTMPAASGNWQLNFTSSTGVTVSGTPAGYNYNITVPVPVTINATSLGTPGTNGLTPSPIATLGTNLPIYELQLSASATGVSKTLTGLTFTSAATQTANSYYFANAYLYSSTSSTFPGTGSATLLSSVATNATNTISFTGFSVTVNPNAILYYFVLVDYNTYIAAATSTYKLNFSSATGATIAAGTANQGNSYTVTSPTFTFTTNSSGISTGPYYYGTNGYPLESFGVTATTVASLNSFTLKSTVAYTNYFSNLQVFYSTNSNYAAALAGGQLTAPYWLVLLHRHL